jgi:NADH-quinone oxidoreductase subunit J
MFFNYLFLFIIFLLSIVICCGSNIILSLISFIGIILNLFIFLYWYNIDFLALIFLIIYIGAIIVLFLFVVFIFDLNNTTKIINLIIVKRNLSDINNNNNFGLIVSSWLLVALLFKSFFLVLPHFMLFVDKLNFFHQLVYLYQTDLIFFFEKNNIDIISFIMYKSYSLYLIVVALLLLISIIGSVLLVKQYKNFK